MNQKPGTIRQNIIKMISKRPASVRDISVELGISEKEAGSHLPHIRKSLLAKKRKLKVYPPSCIKCGYEFKDRKRLTKPGKCPKCRSGRIRSPVFFAD